MNQNNHSLLSYCLRVRVFGCTNSWRCRLVNFWVKIFPIILYWVLSCPVFVQAFSISTMQMWTSDRYWINFIFLKIKIYNPLITLFYEPNYFQLIVLFAINATIISMQTENLIFRDVAQNAAMRKQQLPIPFFIESSFPF